MKKSSKNQKERQRVITIVSFFLGAVIMILLLKSFEVLNLSASWKYKNDMSVSSSLEKSYDATVYVETYTGKLKESTGSGFIYKKDSKYAYILTNEHVIEGDTIEIINSEDKMTEGKLIGKDKYLDLAVIKIDKEYAPKIAKIGNSNKAKIGDFIYAVGAPLGENYQGSLSHGIISGKNRMVQTTAGTTKQDNSWLMSVLQFDASINPGNSGGPLLNSNGEVIGIVTMKLIKEEIEGMSFAIPIEHAMDNIEKLEKGKEIKWPEIGISMVNVSGNNSYYEEIKIPDNIKEGIIVLNVKDESSASNANLQRGDIITKINNNKIKNTAYFKYELFNHKVGEKITITYLRDGKEEKCDVKLSSSE